MACFKLRGTLVPAGITRPLAFASFWLAELSLGTVAADWAKQVEHRKKHNAIQRINFISHKRFCREATISRNTLEARLSKF
jgi:hypothetical protein